MPVLPIPNCCLHDLIAEQAHRTPGQPAVVFEQACLTYAELNARAGRLAGHLQTLGAGPDARIGVCMERSIDLVISLLAILKSGAAYVPLDPSYPRERLAGMMDDAGISIVVGKDRRLSTLALPASHRVAVDADARTIDSAQDFSATACHPDNLAYVIHTSGSTGKPKGAMNTHRGIVNRLEWMQRAYRLESDDRVLQKTPFSFDVSVWEFFWPLMTGATLVVARPDGHRDRDYLANTIAREQITTVHFVPSMLRVFMERLRVSDTAGLRRIICSGETLPADLMNKCLSLLPHVKLHNLYGPTEAAVDVTAWECHPDPTVLRVPIGWPIDNIEIRILDADLQPSAADAAGDLYIAGAGLARGYANRPDLTAERFIPDPFGRDPGSRMYRTGDVGMWRNDGAIEFIGRTDSQIKLRGNRIELGEIEVNLLQHGAVEHAVVMLDRSGTEDQLTAYMIMDEDQDAGDADLRRFLGRRIPAYMIPAKFVRLREFPATANGKLDRNALEGLGAGKMILGDGRRLSLNGFHTHGKEVSNANC